jgi:uncharacterized phage protein (TIGR02216 family)
VPPWGVIPWDAVMAFGIGRLGLSPAAFWQATPRELSAAARGMNGEGVGPAMGRATLAALAARFPDGG